jgi:hypothetical protein
MVATHLSILFVCIGFNVRVILFSTFQACGGSVLSLSSKVVMTPVCSTSSRKILIKLFVLIVQKYLISLSTKESLHDDYKYILFRISRNVFQNTFKYFSGISFQFENFESANLLTHDAFKDIK